MEQLFLDLEAHHKAMIDILRKINDLWPGTNEQDKVVLSITKYNIEESLYDVDYYLKRIREETGYGSV